MLVSETMFADAARLHTRMMAASTLDEFYARFRDYMAALPTVCGCWDNYLEDGSVACPHCGREHCHRCHAGGYCGACRQRF